MRAMAGFTFAALLVVAIVAGADDFDAMRLDNWHHWRGPNANGAAPHADPPLHWDESTNVKWKVEIPGSGTSTPIVWGDRVFLTTAINTQREGRFGECRRDGARSRQRTTATAAAPRRFSAATGPTRRWHVWRSSTGNDLPIRGALPGSQLWQRHLAAGRSGNHASRRPPSGSRIRIQLANDRRLVTLCLVRIAGSLLLRS